MNAAIRSRINQANAAHSTGPKTPEGKQRASLNALKHGLTGQTLILQGHELEAWRELSEALNAELKPKTALETQLVHKIVDCHTRLNRIAAIDNNLLNVRLGENLNGDQGDHTDLAAAQARSWVAQENSFEKLGRYEARLSRQLIAYTKELERLQASRIEKEGWERFAVARATARATRQPAEFKPDRAPLASFGAVPQMPSNEAPGTVENPLTEAA